MSAILFNGLIGPVPVDVVIKEGHRSSLGITEEPIETGAKITDHAYVEPKRIRLEFASANATATYNALVRFQETRIPFVLVSGLYVYTNMLIKELTADRDMEYSQVLMGQADLQEAIIVSTATTNGDEDGGEEGGANGKPGGTKSTNAAKPSAERSAAGTTADRATGTVMRGDTPEKNVPLNRNQSIMSRMFGS